MCATLFELGGKVALVTGGSRGLGLQIAKGLGEMGAKIAISARKAAELEEAKADLKKHGIDALTVTNDLSKADQVPALVEAVVKHYGGINILVNNAGASWGAAAEEHPLEAWNKVMTLERHQRVCLESGGRQSLLHTAALGQHHRHCLDRGAARRDADEGGGLLRLEGGGAASDARAGGESGAGTTFASTLFVPASSRPKWRAACSTPMKAEVIARTPSGTDRRRHGSAGCGGLSGVGRVAACHGAVHRRGWRRLEHMSMNIEAAGLRETPTQHAFDTARLANGCRRTSPDSPVRSKCSNLPAASPIRPSWCNRRTTAMCCGASRPGKLLPSAHAVDREFRVLAALAGQPGAGGRGSMPCAKTPRSSAARSTSWTTSKGAFSGMHCCPRLPRRRRRAIYEEMVRVLAALHSVDYAAVGLARFRQARPLHRAPGGALDAAISRVRNRKDRRAWSG